MKKRDLLFAGLLLMAAPAFAQEGPTFTSQDAKVIFTQDFEADWEKWSTDVVDKIEGVYYYDITNDVKSGNTNNIKIWEDDIWKKKIFRADTIIELTNGVKVTDNAGEIANNNFPGETFTIATDETPERHDAFRNFGEADEGGAKVFKYTSDTCTLEAVSWGTYKGGYTANYRRNLFVRGLPIEEESSYRLTFYLKTKPLPGHDAAPRMSAGIFRGYFASEKPFSMGLEDDADHYKYKTQIEYEKTAFAAADEWEKVTYMTYYLNDSIADNFVFVDGYWWADEWRWNQVVGEDTIKRDYHVQPDKFFVRLGFVSDFTEFQLDNLSLTKSWIGGAEYFGDKLRIDFGYKTNLSDLAKAAKAKTNIAAAEVTVNVPEDKQDELGYEYRFEVWGLTEDDEWEEVYIRSAEYHDDGYMYMFTEFYDEDNSYQFNDYKKVLVTFHNPIDDPELTLKYTGDGKSLDGLFPKALDTTWIKNGKIVPDFYNEIATPNPYVFGGVHSLKDLPPVLQGVEIPNGSIFLNPVKSFSFKFSREVLIDNAGEASEKAIGYVNGVVWTPSFDDKTNTLTITCPDDSWKTMNGDYEVKLIQLYGKGTDKGENVTLSYNFGAPSRTVSSDVTPIDISFTLVGENTSVAKGVYTWSASNKTKGAGTPISTGNLNRMFTHDVEGSGIQRGYEVRPHGGGNGGHVYLGAGDDDYKIHLNPGGYKFSFKGTGWSWNNGDIKPATVYVYKRVADPTSVSADDKMQIGEYNASVKTGDGDLQDPEYAIPVENVDEVEYSFSISEADDYIIEFNNKAGAWSQGVFVGDFELGSVPSTVLYVSNLNDAVTKAEERVELAAVAPELYEGAILDALNDKIEYYKVGGAFDALKATDPAVWTAAAKDMVDATETMKLRMDTADAFNAKKEEVLGKLADNEATFAACPDYIALDNIYSDALEYPVTEKVGSDIYAFNDEMTAAIKKLDDRVALNTKYDNQLARASKLLEAEDARTDLDEYPALETEYNAVKDKDVVTITDDEMSALYAELLAAVNGYDFKIKSIPATTKRINALYDLAKELETETAMNGALKERLDATAFDDDELAEIYKTAIKIAIYDAADVNLDDPKLDSLDVTPFIKNFNLYSVATIDKVEWFNYTYGAPNNRWRLKGDINHVDVFPGWTVRSTTSWGASTNVHIGSEGRAWNDPDPAHSGDEGAPTVFDASLSVDWNSSVTLTQSIGDLPVGMYNLGVNIKSGVDNSTLTAIVTDTVDAEKTMTVEYKLPKNSGNENLFNDSIIVSDGKMDIKFTIGSGSGWSYADDFQLIFRPIDGFDYAGALDELQDHLDELMTVVDASKAVKAGVEYYTIGGIKLDAPKAGQILLRKTTQNGKVVIDKVLMK